MAEKGCEVWNVVCMGEQRLGNVAAGIADDAINNLAKAITEGMSQMVTTLSTFWISMPTVNLASEDGAHPSPVVSAVNSELMPWTLTLAVLAVILGGIRMIWEQRGAPLKDLLRSLLTLTLVSGLGLGVISILVIAADAFSAAIIERSTDGKGFAQSLNVLVMTGQTGSEVHPHRPGPDRADRFTRPDRPDGGPQRHVGDPGGHSAHHCRVHEHGDGQAVVPEGSWLDHCVHSLQARGSHRVLGRVPLDGQHQRARRPGRLYHRIHVDDRCPIRTSGIDAVRHADGWCRRLGQRCCSRGCRWCGGHGCSVPGPWRQRKRQCRTHPRKHEQRRQYAELSCR
jgi:hypothetical protein